MSMRRFVILLLLSSLSGCQFNAVNSSCYECQILSTTSGEQTEIFCDKAEMDRFVVASKRDPTITFMECRNK